MGKQVAGGRLKGYSSKLAVVQLERPEPLFGYAILHLIPLLYLTRSSPQVAAYLLAPCAGGRAFLCFLPNCARAHIASHFQNGQYQHYRQMSTLNILSSYQPQPLIRRSRVYGSPDETRVNNCECSTVVYSLLSACAFCQTNLASAPRCLL